MRHDMHILIAGCGRWLRQDDQAGLRVARLLAAHPPRDARVIETESPAADIAANAEGARLLIVVDAARSGHSLAPGEWRRLDYHEMHERPRREAHPNAHTLSVGAALALVEQLADPPREVWVYAIGAAQAEWGEHMTPRVEAAVGMVAAIIRRDIAAWKSVQREPVHA